MPIHISLSIALLILLPGATNAATVACPTDRQFPMPTAACDHVATPQSGWIKFIEFCEGADRSHLYVQIESNKRAARLYGFAGVSRETWISFKSAPSIGWFFNREIRGQFECTKPVQS